MEPVDGFELLVGCFFTLLQPFEVDHREVTFQRRSFTTERSGVKDISFLIQLLEMRLHRGDLARRLGRQELHVDLVALVRHQPAKLAYIGQ